MSRPLKIYSRLTRNTTGFGGYSSLWLASDHLLVVKATGYSEEYSRIQLRDIKAFMVGKSDRHVVWSIIWGTVCLVPAIILMVTLSKHAVPVVSGFFLAITASLLVWNIFLGPGCVTFIATDAQMAQLKPLVRMKKTRQVIARLTPLILAAQTDLTLPPAENASTTSASA